jgi:hypothetical protein
VRSPNLSIVTWRKSTYSNAQQGECVEVADGLAGVVPVRDSKDPARGVLLVGESSWAALTTALRAAYR